MTQIKIKRVYDPEEHEDGYRVLVDRLWPRGMRKESLDYDLWAKEIAPSTALRQWYHTIRKTTGTSSGANICTNWRTARRS